MARVPVMQAVADVMVGREANACMGLSIDPIVEQEQAHSRHDLAAAARAWG